MKLTLTEAAQLLGISPRQLRYQLKTGTITGSRVAGRWVFEAESLPVSPKREATRAAKAAELQAAVDEALAPSLRPAGRKNYTVIDLSAFRNHLTAARDAALAIGATHPAAAALRDALIALAQGCHSFHQRDKTAAYQRAREHSAAAVALLHLEGSTATSTIAQALERECLPALTGLLRRQERKERR